MRSEQTLVLAPQMLAAIEELKARILGSYPDAQFQVSRGPNEPEAIHLKAVVDVDDLDEVIDLVIDRMMQLQIEDELPIWVVPLHPTERALAMLAARGNANAAMPAAQG